MTESECADGLDGQWLDILSAGTHDGETYTPADLDGMVKDYVLRTDFNKAPVALGLPEEGSPAPVGQVDALRRVGNSLQGKFGGVDPRVEQLYRRGAFPKKSIQVKRSPDGDSLQRIGLIHPHFFNGRQHDAGTPSLDELEKHFMSSKSHVFSGGRGYLEIELPAPSAGIAARAGALVARLKDRGYWSDRWDRAGLPLLFSELEGSPAQDVLARFLVWIAEKADPTSMLFSERARYWARTRSVSFGEALGTISQASWDDHRGPEQVTPQQRELERAASKRAVATGILNEELARLAWERATSAGLTFKQALAEVAKDYPDLAVGQIVDSFSKGSQPAA